MVCYRLDVALTSFAEIRTISDLSHNAKTAFYLPSLMIIDGFETVAPKVAYFFEFTCATGYGFGGFLLSLFGWAVVAAPFFAIYERINQPIDPKDYRNERGY